MPSYQLKTGHSDHVYIHVNLLPRDWLIRNWCGVRNEQVSLIKFYVSDSLKIKKHYAVQTQSIVYIQLVVSVFEVQ